MSEVNDHFMHHNLKIHVLLCLSNRAGWFILNGTLLSKYHLFILKIALLRHNSHTIKFVLLKYTYVSFNHLKSSASHCCIIYSK